MKHKHKPGDMFVIQNKKAGNFVDELIVIVEPTTEISLSGPSYKVYNQTYNMFMDRTQMFLDMFYKKV
jgi:hypothetical protein